MTYERVLKEVPRVPASPPKEQLSSRLQSRGFNKTQEAIKKGLGDVLQQLLGGTKPTAPSTGRGAQGSSPPLSPPVSLAWTSPLEAASLSTSYVFSSYLPETKRIAYGAWSPSDQRKAYKNSLIHSFTKKKCFFKIIKNRFLKPKDNLRTDLERSAV